MHTISKLKYYLTRTAIAVGLAISASACDSMIYDGEGDCDPYYKVRFVYDTNLKFTDAFHAEVFEVTLYVIDHETGAIVRQIHDSSEALTQPGYLMDVDVDPGQYDLIAWCGQGHTSSFDVADGSIATDLRCRLIDRQTPDDSGIGADGSHVRNRLGDLYHGIERDVEFETTQGVHIKTVRLIKDTNDLHIVLQHLSGENIDHRDFTFTVTSDNGHLDHDNSLLKDETLTYFPHSVLSGTAGVQVPDYTLPEGDDSRASIAQVSAAVAHFSLSRMVKGNDMMVQIYNKSGEQIVSVPLIDYALLVRDADRRPDKTPLTDQEYLDYRDDFSMVFFLDENGRWSKTQLYINSWRIINQESEL